jgi:methionyl aminopeptidase
MIISNEQDVQGLCHIGRIIAQILHDLRTLTVPGITTGELDHLCGEMLHARGAMSAPKLAYGFPGELCISVNDEVVHGIPAARVIQAGDLVKLDLEAEKDGYIADATIAVAVPPISREQARLIECGIASLQAGAQAARMGNRVQDIGRAVEREVIRYGFTIVRELGGHGVGRKVHEPPHVPNYYTYGATQILQEGLVITIEPIINAGKPQVLHTGDGWTIRTTDGLPSVHVEHTLIITRETPQIVTTIGPGLEYAN